MTMPSDLSEIKEIIDEIEEKSADGDYIYRGEPKCFEEVSSSLWRQFKEMSEEQQFDVDIIDIDYVQDGILDDAEYYARGAKAGFEMMAQLQHSWRFMAASPPRRERETENEPPIDIESS